MLVKYLYLTVNRTLSSTAAFQTIDYIWNIHLNQNAFKKEEAAANNLDRR